MLNKASRPSQKRWTGSSLSLNITLIDLLTHAYSHFSRLELVNERIEKAWSRFEQELDHQPLNKYLNNLSQTFLLQYSSAVTDLDFSNAKNIFEERLQSLNKVWRALVKYRDFILNLEGIGDDWRRADSRVAAVRETIRWLDELECGVMVDVGELVDNLRARRFEFQQ